MSLESIRARTAARKAAGQIPKYTHAAPVPRPRPAFNFSRPLPCINEGNILQVCHTCNGEGRHVRECEIHSTCTRDYVSDKVRACVNCSDYAIETGSPAPVAPNLSSLTKIDPARLAPGSDGRQFNCSIFDHAGRRLLAYRTGQTGSRVHIAELGPDLQPIRTVPITLTHPRCAMGQEDPRLFAFRGDLYLSFAAVQWDRGKTVVSVMLAHLDSENLQPVRIWEPRLDGRTSTEKNWVFFEHEGELYAVYGIVPNHVVLRCDVPAGTASVAHSTPTRARWSGGLLRGGAPPVRVGDEYYHWFHGWLRSNRPSAPGQSWYEYSVGVYAFEARPPFTVRRMTSNPLWIGDESKAHLNVIRDKNVIFPGGAILDGSRWLVSAGHQDSECLIGEFAGPQTWNASWRPSHERSLRGD